MSESELKALMRILYDSLSDLDMESLRYFGLLSKNSELLFYAGDPEFNEIGKCLTELANKLVVDKIIARSKMGFIAILKLSDLYSLIITNDEGELAILLSILERRLKDALSTARKTEDHMKASIHPYSTDYLS